MTDIETGSPELTKCLASVEVLRDTGHLYSCRFVGVFIPRTSVKPCLTFIRVHLPPLLVQSARFKVQGSKFKTAVCRSHRLAHALALARWLAKIQPNSPWSLIRVHPRSFAAQVCHPAFICGFKSPPEGVPQTDRRLEP